MCTNRNRINKPFLAILLAMVIALGHQAVFLHWTCDDAFISYRYAENLSHGKGLVFNPGERVEGFSNFSWVATLAFFNIFGLSPLWMSKILSLLFSLLLLGSVYLTARALGVGSGGALLCAFLVSSASSLAYFSMSGLETVLYTWLLLFAVYLNKKTSMAPSQKALFFLFAVVFWAAITRPEGILFLLITAIYHTGQGLRQKRSLVIKTVFSMPLFFLSLYGGFVLFRYLYYGDIFPNTFYAKPLGTFVEAGYNAFFVNFASGLISGSFLLIPLVLFMVNRRFLFDNLYPLLFCLAQVLFMSYTGDWMGFGRFFFPIFPLVVILNLTFLSTLPIGLSNHKYKRLASLAAFAFWLAFAGLNGWQSARTVAAKDSYPYFVMNGARLTELGRWLADHFPPHTTIALRRQGAVPYYSQMRSSDFLGLTDKSIARIVYTEKDLTEESRKISRHVVRQKPDLIILFSSKSEFPGWPIAESPSSGRLNHLEYLIHEQATKEGYTPHRSIPLGEFEEAHLFVKPGIPEY